MTTCPPLLLKSTFALLACSLLFAATTALAGDPWLEQAKLIAADGAASDQLGFSVALEGDTAVVGAFAAAVDGNSEQGAAYVFVYDGEDWVEQDKLTGSDGGADDRFGHSVAISGDTILVGATQDLTAGPGPGAAYVFVHDSNGWVEQSKLTASDGAAGDKFGTVALFGETALVGARRAKVDGFDNGAAYVFTRDGAGVWSQQAKLMPDDWPSGSCSALSCPRFGQSVALWEDTALVGAPRMRADDITRAGAAYVFVRETSDWTQQAMLKRPVAAFNGWFGTSVVLRGDAALVGAPNVEVNGNFTQGVTHWFTRNGETWAEQQELTALDGQSGDNFGTSLALLDNAALVGAPSAGLQGAAYVYALEGGAWNEQQKLVASDAADNVEFGASVALSGSTALVGAPGAAIDGNGNQGAAYVFASQDTGAPDLVFDPDTLNFGDVEVGQTSAPQTATLSNTGGADATGLAFNTPGSGFDIDTGDCGATLSAGADCQASVTFTPAETGTASDTLTVEGDDGVSSGLNLTGNGVEPPPEPGILSVEPAELNFGSVGVGDAAVLTATVSNVASAGAEALTVGALGLDGGVTDPSTAMVSLQPDGSQFQYDALSPAVISSDGRYVAFTAKRAANNVPRAYRHDRLTGTTEIVSVTDDGQWMSASDNHNSLAISSDGRHVAFIQPHDIPKGIYIRDMDAGVNEFIDMPTTDGEVPIRPDQFSVSADFRIVAFSSRATNLVPGECESGPDINRCIYVFDRDENTLERISVAYDGSPTDRHSWNPVISADGRFVVFESEATNLVPDDTNDVPDVFVYDRETGVTERVSVASDGSQADNSSGAHTGETGISDITADGRYIAFFSHARNFEADTAGTSCSPVYKCGDIFIRDRVAGTTERLSPVPANGTDVNNRSTWPGITPDGRYVAFLTLSTHLPGADGHTHSYIHDRFTDMIERVSVTTDGTLANDNTVATKPGITPDTRFVTFHSIATNLDPQDSNNYVDVFVRDRGGVADTAFAITGGDCAVGTVLEPGESCMVEITFSPESTGFFEDVLNTETDDEQSASVLLQGTGAVGPVLVFNPSALDFGDVEVGTTSAPENATLTNTGDIDATGLAFTQPTSGFDADTSDCGNTLPPGGSCQVVITFTPPVTGLSFSTLGAESDEGATAGLNLAGNGTQQPPMPDQIFRDRFETGGAQ